MKEITRIFTVQITTIAKIEDESQLVTKEDSAKMVEDEIYALFDSSDAPDDVRVTNIQDFIRDEDEPEQKKSWKDAVMQHFVKVD